MKIAAFIQARLGSERFKSKILQDINGKSVLENVYNRVRQSKKVDSVYIIIPNNEPELTHYLIDKQIRFIEGSPDNVLSRYYTSNQYVKADHIIRITCDSPCICSSTIDDLIKQHLKEKNDYTSNNIFNRESSFDGNDAEIMTKDCLTRVMILATKESDLQHVTTYIRENLVLFKTGILKSKINTSHIRLTVDYPEDLWVVKNVYEYLGNKFTEKDINDLYKCRPDLFNLNAKYKRNSSYYEGIK